MNCGPSQVPWQSSRLLPVQPPGTCGVPGLPVLPTQSPAHTVPEPGLAALDTEPQGLPGPFHILRQSQRGSGWLPSWAISGAHRPLLASSTPTQAPGAAALRGRLLQLSLRPGPRWAHTPPLPRASPAVAGGGRIAKSPDASSLGSAGRKGDRAAKAPSH